MGFFDKLKRGLGKTREAISQQVNNVFKLINTDTAQVEMGVENVYIGNENNEAELCEAYLHNGIEWAVIE